MRNMKVARKLIVGFLIVVLLSIMIGATGIYGLLSMGNAADVMYSKKALPVGDLARAMENFQRCRVLARDAILYTGDTERLKTIESDINERITNFETAMANFEPTITTVEGAKLFADITDNFNSFKPAMFQVINSAMQGDAQNDLLNMMASSRDATNLIESDLSDIIQLRMDVMGTANNENLGLQHMLLIAIIAVIVVSAGISMMLALYISGLISRPLKLLTTFMVQAGSTGDISLRPEDVANIEKCSQIKDEIGQCIGACAQFVLRLGEVGKALEIVADGDLTSELALLSDKDSMGQSLQKMVRSLNDMFKEIYSSVMQVSTGSKQIADGAQSLAQGSTEQAAAVEELSASISAITEKTKYNADISRKAAELSGVIKSNAERGSAQMDQMMQAVSEINDASKQIEKVIKVIDDIAFQTNILALNAAVEAARAGTAGKGFAVVAEEVRSLAAKSAEAAKATGELIENSIEKANLGFNIATETSASLHKIVEGINHNSEIVEQIALSSDEQATAITQINTGIDQVAQVVQQNSATAEESASASEEMNGQSDMLSQLISQFKLKDADHRLSFSSNSNQRREPLAALEKTNFALPNSNSAYGKY